jgi:hypothetical protein
VHVCTVVAIKSEYYTEYKLFKACMPNTVVYVCTHHYIATALHVLNDAMVLAAQSVTTQNIYNVGYCTTVIIRTVTDLTVTSVSATAQGRSAARLRALANSTLSSTKAVGSACAAPNSSPAGKLSGSQSCPGTSSSCGASFIATVGNRWISDGASAVAGESLVAVSLSVLPVVVSIVEAVVVSSTAILDSLLATAAAPLLLLLLLLLAVVELVVVSTAIAVLLSSVALAVLVTSLIAAVASAAVVAVPLAVTSVVVALTAPAAATSVTAAVAAAVLLVGLVCGCGQCSDKLSVTASLKIISPSGSFSALCRRASFFNSRSSSLSQIGTLIALPTVATSVVVNEQ